MSDRLQRRRLFDAAAEDYDATRPGYPDALFDAVEERAPARRPLRILEIGCGTGQATRAWAERGHTVLAVELGGRLAALAARNLAAFPRVEIRNDVFEEADLPDGAFDVVFAASSYHWVDAETGNARLPALLAAGGVFAACWNLQGSMLEELQDLYHAHVPELARGRTGSTIEERIERRRTQLETGGHLRDIELLRWPWSRRIDAQAYTRLMGTYSDHLALEPAVLRGLQEAVAARIESFGGTIERAYDTVLFVARPVPAR